MNEFLPQLEATPPEGVASLWNAKDTDAQHSRMPLRRLSLNVLLSLGICAYTAEFLTEDKSKHDAVSRIPHDDLLLQGPSEHRTGNPPSMASFTGTRSVFFRCFQKAP